MTEFCNNIFVTDCFIFTSNFNKCSPPRKDKHSKTLTGKYVVPHERIIIVNPNGRKQREIPEKESPGIPNPKQDTSWHQNELFPRCQWENSNKRSKLAPKGVISEVPEKAKKNPQEGVSGNFQYQGRSELAPNGINSEVTAGQFQRRSELAQQLINSKVPAGEFRANGV